MNRQVNQNILLPILVFSTVTLLTMCTPQLFEEDVSMMSIDKLIEKLKNPNSDEFIIVVGELWKRGPRAAKAAPYLAIAMAYPRRDSIQAGNALISMGALAKEGIPNLISNLQNQRADVRQMSAFVLGTIGESALCTVPNIAPLLWDKDEFVRTSAAAAIDNITGESLVSFAHKLYPPGLGSVPEDMPEGSVTGDARSWWKAQGSLIDWNQYEDNC